MKKEKINVGRTINDNSAFILTSNFCKAKDIIFVKNIIIQNLILRFV